MNTRLVIDRELKRAIELRDALIDLKANDPVYRDVEIPTVAEVIQDLNDADNKPAPMFTDDYEV